MELQRVAKRGLAGGAVATGAGGVHIDLPMPLPIWVTRRLAADAPKARKLSLGAWMGFWRVGRDRLGGVRGVADKTDPLS